MSLRLTSPTVAKEIVDTWLATGVDESERPNIKRVEAMDAAKRNAMSR